MNSDARLNNIMAHYYGQFPHWTRAVLLHKIGELKLCGYENLVRSRLNDQEPLVRETALWSLAQLKPADLPKTLSAHADDESTNIRKVVAELLTNLASPAA